MSLIKHPQCSKLSGGQAIELLAKDGDRTRFHFRTPMGQTYDCCFSFAGLRNQVTMTIMKTEAEEGTRNSLFSKILFVSYLLLVPQYCCRLTDITVSLSV